MQERVFLILAVMIIIPIFMQFVIPYPYSLMAIMTLNLFLLFVMRKNMKGLVSGMLGAKAKLVCMNCGKPHNDTKCPSCGSRMRRLG